MEIWKMVQSDYINRNVGATAEEHRQAVSDALDAGEQVPAEVLEDYPQFKKRTVQLDETKQEESMMPNIPEEKSIPVDPIQAYKDKQNAEIASYKAKQDAEVARVKAIQDAEVAKFRGFGNETMSTQDAEIARVKREQDAEIAKMNSTAMDYQKEQDAEIARFKREQDEAIARSSLGGGSSAFETYPEQQSAPAEEMPLQSEEEMLSTLEEPGALESKVPEFNEPGTPEDTFSQDELLKLHLARSRQARVIDERYRAKDVASPGDQQGNRRWVRNPAKTDIEGIDTPR